jgi:hypothetical protein
MTTTSAAFDSTWETAGPPAPTAIKLDEMPTAQIAPPKMLVRGVTAPPFQ